MLGEPNSSCLNFWFRPHQRHYIHPQRILGAKGLRGQHITHRAAPAASPDHSEDAASERKDTEADFFKREAGIVRRDADVGRQRQLKSTAVALALHHRDQRFAALTAGHPPRVHLVAVNGKASRSPVRKHIRHIGTNAKMGAIRSQQRAANVGIGLNLGEDPADQTKHLHRQAVALHRPVQPDMGEVSRTFADGCGHRYLRSGMRPVLSAIRERAGMAGPAIFVAVSAIGSCARRR